MLNECSVDYEIKLALLWFHRHRSIGKYAVVHCP